MATSAKTTGKPAHKAPTSAAERKLAQIKAITERPGLSAADQLSMIYEIVGTK